MILVAGLLLVAGLSAACTYLIYRLYLRPIDLERRQLQELSSMHLATIEALALAIDAKDQTGANHIRRVQVYATGLAKALGMSAPEIQGVRTAALLHDIGKLAIPEHILSKPGPLTPEEFHKVRTHSQVGAEIIGAVPFRYPVARLILSHHEQWDGRGYPAGLRGEAIPLGARILAVADCYDVLTSDRPYHRAMSDEAAVRLLEQEAGKAFDPAVVSTFVRMLPELRAEAEAANAAAAAKAATRTESAKTVFDEIALAHREIYALYEVAQALGTSLGVTDTMSLVSTKLANLVPFSSCALFLGAEDTDLLQCRFASGTEAATLQKLKVRSGHGLAHQAAQGSRPTRSSSG